MCRPLSETAFLHLLLRIRPNLAHKNHKCSQATKFHIQSCSWTVTPLLRLTLRAAPAQAQTDKVASLRRAIWFALLGHFRLVGSPRTFSFCSLCFGLCGSLFSGLFGSRALCTPSPSARYAWASSARSSRASPARVGSARLRPRLALFGPSSIRRCYARLRFCLARLGPLWLHYTPIDFGFGSCFSAPLRVAFTTRACALGTHFSSLFGSRLLCAPSPSALFFLASLTRVHFA